MLWKTEDLLDMKGDPFSKAKVMADHESSTEVKRSW